MYFYTTAAGYLAAVVARMVPVYDYPYVYEMPATG